MYINPHPIKGAYIVAGGFERWNRSEVLIVALPHIGVRIVSAWGYRGGAWGRAHGADQLRRLRSCMDKRST